MKFPEIDYEFWLSYWKENIGSYAVYTNRNMVQYIDFKGDINACTNEISSITKSGNMDKASILRVIDLIYSWGGRSGRLFYVSSGGKPSPREELETNEDVFSKYVEGVEMAKEGNLDGINMFCQIRGIGPSYASKHAYFWSVNSENPLIIIDSKIAGALGYKTIKSLKSVHRYDSIISSFTDKAANEFGDSNPSNVEKALFAFHNNYFLNKNTDWKNNIKDQVTDYAEAVRISNVLFEH